MGFLSFGYSCISSDSTVAMFERMFAQWPDSIRERLIEYHLRSLRKSLQEWPARSRRNPENELVNEVRHGGDIPDVPLIVLTAMGLDPFMAAFMPEPFLGRLTMANGLCIQH